MGLELQYEDGQTLLDDEEREGILIPTITTRGELDELEQYNIEQAMLWSVSRRFKQDLVFTEKFIQTVHRQMYGLIWDWAGQFRKTNKNIGVDKWQIAAALKYLLDDASFWYAHKTYLPDEAAVRFKHRLVSIHCFPNGNGRHSRLMADIIINKLYQQPVFSWGAAGLIRKGEARSAYLAALKVADAGNIQPLLQFARS
ncbi:MAG: mobile mystery protein B [Chitinophagaceae bacterium]|nr:mobile mystery protein B [Chitinophagaceae bacterium]